MSSQKGKDVLYIDVDDEITTIIDKVRSSHERIVALVLPKRATVFQSIVNMRLLKRTADAAKKHLVLITSEAGLMPLAGAVGMHVAKSLQSKPEVPGAPNVHDDVIDEVDESASMAGAEQTDLDASKPVGEFVRTVPPSVANPMDAEDDMPIELDNTTPAALPAAGAGAKKSDGKKGGRFKIPDFNRFRLVALLSVLGLVLVIAFWYVGFVVMPKATIAVKTDSSTIDVNMDVIFKTDAEQVDVDAAVVPAEAQQAQKTVSQQADATGEKDKGAKATGTIRFYNCNKNDTLEGKNHTIPAGTGVSVNNLTFITSKAVSVEPSHFAGNTCLKDEKTAPVGITAQAGGEKYNLGAATYGVAGFSSVKGEGSKTTGGTTEIVKIVTQSDIDGAKQKIASQDTEAVKAELGGGLEDKKLHPLDGTFVAADPEITTSAQVGDEAGAVTVTQTTTYTMLGAKQDDLEKLIANEVNEQIDPQKQSILDHGLDEAVFKLQNQQETNTLATLEATAVAGSDLNLAEIKEEIAGKKANDAKEFIGDYPGVTEVTVDYSPFWVSSIPKKTSKITITVETPSAKDAER